MTTSTPTLGLTLYDSSGDQAVYFSTFRAVIAGTATTSNFYKIDTGIASDRTRISSLENTRGAILVSAIQTAPPSNYAATGIAEITAYSTNMTIILKLDVSSSTSVILNINGLGDKTVSKINSSGSVTNISGGELRVGKNYLFRYDGTQWIWVSATSADQIYTSGTIGNFLMVSADNTVEDSSFYPSYFAIASKGVTNGDSHDHVGGDGGTILYSSLGNNNGWIEVSDTWTTNSQAYTNNPSSGSNIVLNMTSTSLFAIGDTVTVSSSAGSENATISALVLNTSITLNSLSLDHTTTSPVVIAMKFTVPSDATLTYSVGEKIRFKQGGAYKYCYVKAVTSTQIVLAGQQNYVFSTSTITNIAHSFVESPYLFPQNFTFSAVLSGFSTTPVFVFSYSLSGGKVFYQFSNNDGIGNADLLTASTPFSARTLCTGSSALVRDNGINLGTGYWQISASASFLQFYKPNLSAWTAGSGKGVYSSGFYEI